MEIWIEFEGIRQFTILSICQIGRTRYSEGRKQARSQLPYRHRLFHHLAVSEL